MTALSTNYFRALAIPLLVVMSNDISASSLERLFLKYAPVVQNRDPICTAVYLGQRHFLTAKECVVPTYKLFINTGLAGSKGFSRSTHTAFRQTKLFTFPGQEARGLGLSIIQSSASLNSVPILNYQGTQSGSRETFNTPEAGTCKKVISKHKGKPVPLKVYDATAFGKRYLKDPRVPSRRYLSSKSFADDKMIIQVGIEAAAGSTVEYAPDSAAVGVYISRTKVLNLCYCPPRAKKNEKSHPYYRMQVMLNAFGQTNLIASACGMSKVTRPGSVRKKGESGR